MNKRDVQRLAVEQVISAIHRADYMDRFWTALKNAVDPYGFDKVTDRERAWFKAEVTRWLDRLEDRKEKLEK